MNNVVNNKNRSKTSVKIGPAERVNEFGKNKFYSEGGMLWCKICNKSVDHVRRQAITDHLQSIKHRDRANSVQRSLTKNTISNQQQTTIPECIERLTAATITVIYEITYFYNLKYQL